MKLLRKISIWFVFVVHLSSPTLVKVADPAGLLSGITGTAVSGLATGELLKQVIDALHSLIGRAEQAGDFMAVRAGQEALFVLDAFQQANESLLKTAFKEIGKERQAIINQVIDVASKIEKGTIAGIQALNDISDGFRSLALDVAFKQMPVIYRYRGGIVTPGETLPIRLMVEGYRLTQGTPRLMFRKKTYEAKKDGERLRFELPRHEFVANKDVLKSEDATLILEGKQGGFFGFFAKPVQVEYDLDLITLPTNVGTIHVTHSETTTIERDKEVKKEESHSSSSRSWDCRSIAYKPSAPERRFDVEYSKVLAGNGNSRGRLQDVRISTTGISFRLCAKRRLTDRDNGFRHARVQYREVWTVYKTKPKTVTRPITWSKDERIPVGDAPSPLEISVEEFTGNTRAVPSTGGMAGRYINVINDALGHALLVKPVVPSAYP